VCGEKRNLNVHHKSYSEGKEPWEYPLENFVLLCAEHHRDEHGLKPKICSEPSCDREIAAEFTHCYEHHVKNKYGDNSEKIKEVLDDHQKNLKSLLTKKEGADSGQRKQLDSQIQVLNKSLSNLSGTIENIQARTIPEPQKKPNKSVAGVFFALAVIAIASFWFTRGDSAKPVKAPVSKAPIAKIQSDQYSGHIECPKKRCTGVMSLKKSPKTGQFYGCSNFPTCRETIDHPFKCALCKSPMETRPGQFGKFWGCTKFKITRCEYSLGYQ
jgi:hypothetical protein